MFLPPGVLCGKQTLPDFLQVMALWCVCHPISSAVISPLLQLPRYQLLQAVLICTIISNYKGENIMIPYRSAATQG